MDLEQELSVLSRITGISIEETESSTLNESDHRILKHHSHTGHCVSLPFCVEYDISLSKRKRSNEWADQEYKLSDISITLHRKQLSKEFSALLQRSQKLTSLTEAYMLLCSYAKLHQERQQCFQQIADNIPDNLEVQSADEIRIFQNEGLSALIKWKIQSGPGGQAKPIVAVRLSAETTEDYDDIIESAPAMFDGLQKKHGHRKAIDVITQRILQQDK